MSMIQARGSVSNVRGALIFARPGADPDRISG